MTDNFIETKNKKIKKRVEEEEEEAEEEEEEAEERKIAHLNAKLGSCFSFL